MSILPILLHRLARRADALRIRAEWDAPTEQWTVYVDGATVSGPSLPRCVEALTAMMGNLPE